jgi:hypothetical protein
VITFSLVKVVVSLFTPYYPYTFLPFYWYTSCRITKEIFMRSFPLLTALSKKDKRKKKGKVGSGKKICI